LSCVHAPNTADAKPKRSKNFLLILVWLKIYPAKIRKIYEISKFVKSVGFLKRMLYLCQDF